MDRRPFTPKRPKTEKQKHKEQLAKKLSQRLDLLSFKEGRWIPVEEYIELFTECSAWYSWGYGIEDKPCGTCHMCTNRPVKTKIVGWYFDYFM